MSFGHFMAVLMISSLCHIALLNSGPAAKEGHSVTDEAPRPRTWLNSSVNNVLQGMLEKW